MPVMSAVGTINPSRMPRALAPAARYSSILTLPLLGDPGASRRHRVVAPLRGDLVAALRGDPVAPLRGGMRATPTGNRSTGLGML